MSAGAALQAALAATLEGVSGIDGVYDGAPARAAFPYVVIDCGQESDWGHKSGAGREVLVAATVWHDQQSRLFALADAVECALLGIDPAGVEGWQLVSRSLIRRRVVRDVAGPWATAIDVRARLLKL